MIGLYRHIYFKILFSVILITIGSMTIMSSLSDILESLEIIKTSKNISQNPTSLKKEIELLEEKRNELSEELERLDNLTNPDFDDFTEIANKFKLKLTGVHLKHQSALKGKAGKKYQFIFTGRLTSILNALNYIEKNLILKFNSINLQSSTSDSKLIDMGIIVELKE